MPAWAAATPSTNHAAPVVGIRSPRLAAPATTWRPARAAVTMARVFDVIGVTSSGRVGPARRRSGSVRVGYSDLRRLGGTPARDGTFGGGLGERAQLVRQRREVLL